MSLLSRLMPLFDGASFPRRTAKTDRPKTPHRPGTRDPVLEERARELLLPIAPALSEGLVAGWNPRMRTTAGVALPHRREIWLNPALREISAEEVERTFLHELAHLLASFRNGPRRLAPHGPEWREACRDLGIPGEGRTHRLPFRARRLKRRYLLSCPGCGEGHERVRPPRGRLACLACCRLHHGGHYHERFRFRVSLLAESGCSSGPQRSPK